MQPASVAIELPDHAGESYVRILGRLHSALQPKSYLEIGVATGMTLQFARCATIAVDPVFNFREPKLVPDIINKPQLHLFQMPSDDFFTCCSPTQVFGQPIEFAFLDGMHLAEYLLRDFINTERHCRRDSVVALHDCLPLEVAMTGRVQGSSGLRSGHRAGWWTGDVWRAALLLRRHRPDLKMLVLDAEPTGLILITHLNPASTILHDSYDQLVETMMSWDLGRIGVSEFFAEMEVTSTNCLKTEEDFAARFRL